MDMEKLRNNDEQGIDNLSDESYWGKQVGKREKAWKRRKNISKKSRKNNEKEGKNQVLDAFQQASSPNPY